MTHSPPDMTGPAQPPTDGVRELLAFVAVTVAAYVTGVVAVAALFRLVG